MRKCIECGAENEICDCGSSRFDNRKKIKKGNIIIKTHAIIQARMGSGRFPNKVLADLNGMPVLEFLINRLKYSSNIDNIIIITTDEFEDKKIVDFCRRKMVNVYRDNNPVIEKVIECTDVYDTDIIVDITADCPLIDYRQADTLLNHFIFFNYDYVSNIWPRSWPDGFDIQIYKPQLLNEINEIIVNPQHKNHSGWNIGNNRDKFDLKEWHLLPPQNYYYPEWGLTIDYPEDLELLNKIVNFFPDDKFSIFNVIDLLKTRPELLKINQDCKRKVPGNG